ncbi:MAG: ATP-dependent zinc metalloprotease FtsH [Clostridia bacterium]|jgi:cell division protease FtsH|nr:ATP-dependent zinc metalloprotease FtsH [Clostridia bacterium]MDD4275366.1 ATP-dependent zinc metalloprotease FtsH [Clostridia bacterium]
MKDNKTKGFIIALVILLAFAILFYFASASDKGEEISYSELQTLIDANEVSDIYADSDGLMLVRTDDSEIPLDKFPKKADYYLTYISTSQLDYITDYNNAVGRLEEDKINLTTVNAEPSILETLAPYILIIIGFLFLLFILKTILNANAKNMNFGKNKARLISSTKIKFSDVAGIEEEKNEVKEIIDFLKNPRKFIEVGARIPKGFLLVGAPGTGKTLLAKAIAGEAEVPFFSISGSDFVEMFVGVGASRVRDLFEQAKHAKPCIVFIDEIDAVGRQRGAGLGGGNDEREQTLNQLLVEMDGFESNEGIIVLAATNRPDVLDPALTRPGRFDRQIVIYPPDVLGREKILKIHARNKPVDDNVDFARIAKITSGFTGADLENLLNEAAILAARANRAKVSLNDITEGINKVLLGPQKRSRIITEEDKKITAYHESGHALLSTILEHCDKVQEVSIIPRGMAGGYTLSRPENDAGHTTKQKLLDTVTMALGGRAAEEIMIKDVSAGAQSDFKQATATVRKMVAEWGMSDKLGTVYLGETDEVFLGRDYQAHSKYSEKTAASIDDAIKDILTICYKRAVEVLTANKEKIELMSKVLLEHETIYSDEIDMIMAGKPIEEISASIEEKIKIKRIQEDKDRDDREKKEKTDTKINIDKSQEDIALKAAKVLADAGFPVKTVRVFRTDSKLEQVENEQAKKEINEILETIKLRKIKKSVNEHAKTEKKESKEQTDNTNKKDNDSSSDNKN